MTTPIVIVGCGGFGREVHDVVDALAPEWDLVGYVDDAPSPGNVALVERRGSRVIGGTPWFAAAPPETRYVIGIGSGSVRRVVDERLTAAGFAAADFAAAADAELLGNSRRGPAGTFSRGQGCLERAIEVVGARRRCFGWGRNDDDDLTARGGVGVARG